MKKNFQTLLVAGIVAVAGMIAWQFPVLHPEKSESVWGSFFQKQDTANHLGSNQSAVRR